VVAIEGLPVSLVQTGEVGEYRYRQLRFVAGAVGWG
jgi:hypothetical protein